ncbi:MAG: hypothetical protein ACP5QY_11785, partial [Candidatus Hydrogenedens sp.]
RYIQIFFIVVLLVVGILFSIVIWSIYRTNKVEVDQSFRYSLDVMYSNGLHNSNSDMICWRGVFYLIHANSPFHLGSTHCKLWLWKSDDGVKWEKIREFNSPGEDIRDPKFAEINGQLFLYVLVNRNFFAEPYRTLYARSMDGRNWTPFEPLKGDAEGWLLWRPKTRDFINWYVTGYWNEHGKSALFRSRDGINWELVSIIHEGDRNDETDFEFLPDNTIICTARLEYSDSWLGHPEGSTLVATAKPPYKEWSKIRDKKTRLDGPCLFAFDGKVFAIGRRDYNNTGPLWYMGSILNRKRTSLWYVELEGLKWLTDFPSAGDTAYGGVAMRGENIYICYYSSPITRDYPWIIGMLKQTDILMLKCGKDDFREFCRSKIKK